MPRHFDRMLPGATADADSPGDLGGDSIAGEFAVRSSLSDGYKLTPDIEANRVVQSGYNWNNSVFDLPKTQNPHRIIDFDLGNYEGGRSILIVAYAAKVPRENRLALGSLLAPFERFKDRGKHGSKPRPH